MVADGWRNLTLKAIADIVSGVGFPRKHQGSQRGKIPFFKVSDMNTPGNERGLRVAANTVDERLLNSLKGKLHPPGTVVFPKVGAALLTNKRRRLVVPSCFDNNVMGLVPTGCDPDYLYLLMQTVDFADHVQSGAVPSINGSMVGSIRVLVPTLTEQRKIAAILSSVDDAIEKTQAVIDQVQVVKRGLMQELLTRGLPGRHTRFKQTEIGEIPADWDARSIDALVISCDYGTSDALRNDGIGVPVLRMGNLQDGRVSLEDVKYIAADKVPDELMLSEGDVLFNRTNSADLVGKVAVFFEQQRKVSFASYLLRLRVEPKQGNGYWLSYLLNTPELQKKLRSTATPGVSQVNISRRNLLATVVPVPSVEEQATIVSVLDSIQHRVDAEQRRADQLAVIKSALMSVLLTGELRVTPDHEPV